MVADCHKNDLALIGDMVVRKSSKMKKIGEKLAEKLYPNCSKTFSIKKRFLSQNWKLFSYTIGISQQNIPS
jgi:hypothetical protein